MVFVRTHLKILAFAVVSETRDRAVAPGNQRNTTKWLQAPCLIIGSLEARLGPSTQQRAKLKRAGVAEARPAPTRFNNVSASYGWSPSKSTLDRKLEVFQ